jgi:hypothetical protein
MACSTSPTPAKPNIERTILTLLDEQEREKTICPSEVARAVAGDGGSWRQLMADVRLVADRLVGTGHLRVTQRGAPVPAVDAVGPIRLGKPLE